MLRSSTVPARLTRSTIAAIGVAVGALLLTGCSNSLDGDKLIDLIEGDLADDLGAPITDVECPEVSDPSEGDTFECDVQIDGQPGTVTGTVTDADDGTVSVVVADTVLGVEALEGFISEDLAANPQVGEVDIDCGDTTVIVTEPDATFECAASDAAGGEGVVVVTVLDAEGAVSYELNP